MGAETAIATAAIVGAVAGTASAGYSIYQGEKQQKKAKAQEREARKVQAEQRENALKERKDLIDQQREGLFGHYRTKSQEQPQASGLVGKLDNDLLG